MTTSVMAEARVGAVTGAGSKWTSNAAYALGVGPLGTLSITDGGEVQQTRATGFGGFFLAGGSMSVDGTSIAEAGTRRGESGLFDDRPQWLSGGIGTYTANIIDNGDLAASDAGGFQGNGTLTINGSITGTGGLTVGAQETLGAQRRRQPDGERVRRFLRLVRHARNRQRGRLFPRPRRSTISCPATRST